MGRAVRLGQLPLAEEDPDLARRRGRRVGTVGYVFVDGGGAVAANAARGGVGGIGGSHQAAPAGDGVLALEHHGHDRAAGDERDQALVEGFALVLTVVARSHLERIGGGANTEEAEANDERAWARIGREQMRGRNFQAAEEPLRRAVSHDPLDASLRLDLASTLWENNKPAEAELQAREAVALLPASAAGHRLLGGLLLWRGAHLEAAESLERAATLTEPDAALLIELGRAWDGAAGEATASEGRDRLTRAEAAYRRAVGLAPEHSEAAYGLAQVLRRRGRDQEAAAEMERYEQLYRDDQEDTREGGLEAAEPPKDG